jgi:hypothetical protein
MTENVEKLLNAAPLTESESNRFASIKRVSIANRKSENQRHADAIGAIEARELFDLKQLADAVNRRLAEHMEERYG